jgi:hypothetical protein
MSNSSLSAGPNVVPCTGVDLSAALGKLVKITAGAVAVNDSATVPAKALVLEGNLAARQSTLAILGAVPFACFVQIAAGSAALAFGDYLQQAADGTFTKDTGAPNARCICGVVTDPAGAVAGQLVAAVVFRPVATAAPSVVTAPGALTETSAGTIAGLNSTAVNPTKADYDLLLAEAGKLQADFYADHTKLAALHTALVAQGILAIA